MKKNGAWFSLWVLFLLGNTLTLGKNPAVGENAWLMLLLGFLFVLPLYALYSISAERLDEHDLFSLLQKAFGPVIGKGMALLLVVFLYVISTCTLGAAVNMIQMNALPNTSPYALALLLVVPALLGVSYGTQTLGRFAQIILVPVLLTILMFLGFSLRHLNLRNLFPLLGEGVPSMVKGGLWFVSVPFGEGLLLFGLNPGEKPKMTALKAGLLAAVLIALSYLRNQLVLGRYWIYAGHPFTYEMVMDSGREVLFHIDLSSVIVLEILGILKLCVYLILMVNGLACVFPIKKKKTKTLLSCVLAVFVWLPSVNLTMNEVVSQFIDHWYAPVSSVMMLGLPFLTILTLLLRGKLRKRPIQRSDV